MRALAVRVTENRRFEFFIIAVIIVNALTLGLATSAWGREHATLLEAVDRIALTIFVIELVLKMTAQGGRFAASGWNVFDLTVVAIALVPTSGPLAILRALRILRVLRLVSSLPALRRVVGALAGALRGMAAIGALLVLIFYIGAVMATSMFGETFPQWFGSLGHSAYSLFQIMTLESWSMGIVRPVMEVHSWAWAFFVPFILVASFTVLNLFIAVVVDSMANLHEDDPGPAVGEVEGDERVLLERVQELQVLTAKLADDLARSGLGSASDPGSPRVRAGDGPGR